MSLLMTSGISQKIISSLPIMINLILSRHLVIKLIVFFSVQSFKTGKEERSKTLGRKKRKYVVFFDWLLEKEKGKRKKREDICAINLSLKKNSVRFFYF